MVVFIYTCFDNKYFGTVKDKIMNMPSVDEISKIIERLVAENARLRANEKVLVEALKQYAKENEWSSESGNAPWKMVFNNSFMDGDGYERAKQALAQVKQNEEK